MLAQQEVLEDLFVFKAISGEDDEQFGNRLRDIFDRFVTHRRTSDIQMPNFPPACTGTQEISEELNELIEQEETETTYL